MTLHASQIDTATRRQRDLRFAPTLRHLVAAFRRYAIARKTRRALDALDARALHDIGLARGSYASRPEIEVPAGLMNRLMSQR